MLSADFLVQTQSYVAKLLASWHCLVFIFSNVFSISPSEMTNGTRSRGKLVTAVSKIMMCVEICPDVHITEWFCRIIKADQAECMPQPPTLLWQQVARPALAG